MNITPAEKQALHAGWKPHDNVISGSNSSRSLRPEAEADFDEPPTSSFEMENAELQPNGRGMHAMEVEDEGAGLPGPEQYAMRGAVEPGDDIGGSGGERDSDDL
ncbi:uncharacterized protein DSM5745_00992 [Aspergillus mulundensis]|uniref:Uncharacterized protein n=1 Tax=Aspergillus mulundensis TaxID=1810919 RepID=A0A3D8T546_9EURO|nr:hypothetical protein DSM5745_00992 [Aspergillus mulundensis]RDW93670.1 hypothetical protein DSM5745_00992 [Aspergillus mulundensis]